MMTPLWRSMKTLTDSSRASVPLPPSARAATAPMTKSDPSATKIAAARNAVAPPRPRVEIDEAAAAASARFFGFAPSASP